MIFLWMMACNLETDKVAEVKAAEKQVSDVMASITDAMAKNKVELERVGSELQKAKEKNALYERSDKRVYETCPSACQAWRNKASDVPKTAVQYFNAYDSQERMRCDNGANEKPQEEDCTLSCEGLCDMLLNDGLDLPFIDFKQASAGSSLKSNSPAKP